MNENEDEDEDQILNMWYAGTTSRSAELRQASDQKLSDKNASLSRVTNFYGIAEKRNWPVYVFDNLNVPPVHDAAEMKDFHHYIGYIEDVLIKSIGEMGLNSANGGSLIDWVPEAALDRICEASLQEGTISRNYVPTSQEVRRLVRNHHTRYLNFTDNAYSNMPSLRTLRSGHQDKIIEHNHQPICRFF